MGGKAPAAPPDRSLETQQAQWAREDTQRAAEEARAATAKEEARTRFGTARDAAVAGARGAAGTTLSSRGLSTDEFMPLIESEISRISSSIPDLAESPGTYFGPDLADVVLNREQENRRTKYGQTVNEYFTPSYAENQWQGTADDALIDSILGEASGTAQSAVERAKARGQLDDTGYTAATNRLNTATTTGRSRAQELGGTVIERNRQALRDIGGEASSAAGGYTLGGTFDPDVYKNKATSRYGEQQGTFEGDVRGAIGDASQFYDIGDIIGFGAREQGSQNTASSPLAETLAKRETARTARRGVGGTGTF